MKSASIRARSISLCLSIAIFSCLSPQPAFATGTARTAAGELRCAYTSVRVAVDGDLARTIVTQVFVNDLPSAVEATYGFPLPTDAAVTGFADWRDGKRQEARADDRDAAARTYDRAADEGKRAALAETEGENRFKMKLAGIAAHGTRRVELRYTQTLSALAGELSYVFPAAKGESTPPPTLLDVEVAVAGDRPLTHASALNHADARLDREGGQLIARLHRAHEGLERDFALRWQVESQALDLAARAVRAKPGEPAYLEARVAFNRDPVPLHHEPVDVVIVVDTSLSMAGEPLERAQTLADGVLLGLQPGDRANVISFSDAVASVRSSLVPAERAQTESLRDAVRKLRAHGRSNLEAALDEAANLLRKSDRGLLVLLTDGQPTVGATLETPAAVRTDFQRTRVVVAHFNYPSQKKILEGLFPNVTTQYVPDGSAGDEAVAALTRLAIAPSLEGLTLEVAGPSVSGVEGAIPTRLAVGESLRLMARTDGDAMVRLSGTLHGRPFHLEERVRIAEPDGRGDRGLAVEWARMRVRSLETRLEGHPPDAAKLTDEVRALGKSYGLMTRFTSFVSSDSLSPDRIKPGDPEIRIRAPRESLGVRAVLPWGEVVECAWQPDEALWLGRFLSPRAVTDGIYRVRVFVDTQAGTLLRGTLFFQVDSKPPTFVLSRDGEGPIARGATLRLTARVKSGVFDRAGDAIVRDRIDLKHIVVQVGAETVPLVRLGDSDEWQADVPIRLPVGVHRLRLTASDFASNSSEAALTVEVR